MGRRGANVSKWIVALFAVLALLLAASPAAGAGIVVGTAVPGSNPCLEVTDSTYLNVTLCSSEAVNVTLESRTPLVSFTIRPDGDALSTELSIRGFEPGKTYYRYEEAHLQESFVADSGGSHSYLQDLSTPHHVFITETRSTKYLRVDATGGDCTSFGAWEGSENVCVLTQDVFETIVVDGDGITLDGGGHMVRAGFGTYGVYEAYRTGTTIRNLVIRDFVTGVFLFYANGNTVMGTTIGTSCYDWPSIDLDHSRANTIDGNTITGDCARMSFRLSYSDDNALIGNALQGDARMSYSDGNTIRGNRWPPALNVPTGGGLLFDIVSSNRNTIRDNRITTDWWRGLFLTDSSENILSGNEIRGAAISLLLTRCDDNLVTGNLIWYGSWGTFSLVDSSRNTVDGNTATNGIGIEGGSDNILSGNTVTSGLLSLGGSGNTATGNTLYGGIDIGGTANLVSGNTVWNSGISIVGSSNAVVENRITGASTAVSIYSSLNTVRGNTVSGGSTGVSVRGNSNLVTENRITTSSMGIGVVLASGNTVTRNTIQAYIGISLGSYSGWNTVSENTVTNSVIGVGFSFFAAYNVVTRNVLSENSQGVSMVDSVQNTFSYNLVSNNRLGINIVVADYNHIFFNCFEDNGQQLNRYSSSTTTWEDGAGHGNYWSDYRGLDDGSNGRTPGDGVGDTNIPHLGVDWYPLMDPACVGNTAPIIHSFTATVSPEGTPTVFEADASDPENDALTYSWDVDSDGAFEFTGSSNTFTYTWGDDHTGTATVRVSDGEFSAEATVSVTVTNAAPTVVFTVGEAVEGQPLSIAFRVTDPGSDDLTATVDWGDGATTGRAYPVGMSPDAPESTDANPRDVSDELSHVYGDNANLAGTLILEDDDGARTVLGLTMAVVNGEPEVTTATVQDGDEGQTVSFVASARDPGSDDLTFCWDWDDGTQECRIYYNDGSGADPAGSTDGTFPFMTADAGTHVWNDDGTYDVALTVTDDDGGFVSMTLQATIANVAPTPSIAVDASSYVEGSSVAALAAFADPGSDDVTLTWSWDLGPTATRIFYNDGAGPDPRKSPTGTSPFSGTDAMSYTYADNGVFMLTVGACDDDGGCATASEPVVVFNADPVVSITGPVSGSVVQAGAPVALTGAFTDAGSADTHVAQWTIDTSTLEGTVIETTGTGIVSDTYVFAAAGVYRIALSVGDDDGGIGTANTVADLAAFVVVYDPNGGFVTGGGWILSPLGAYAADATLTGKASFGFVSKYQKGAATPSGATEFQFRVANLNFHSASYEWLVVSGSKAQFKGYGTINGAGDFGFLLTATDGALSGGGNVDQFRIKIWDRASGLVVYDNQMGADDSANPTTAIGGGSIVIHKA